MTNLEQLIFDFDTERNDSLDTLGPSNWTGARWMTEGDILFFYQAAFRAKMYAKRLLSQCRRDLDRWSFLIDVIEHNLNLIQHYGGTIFACAQVTGVPKYIQPEEDSHWSNRTYVPFEHVHFFENPLPNDRLKRFTKINQVVVPLVGSDLDGLLSELAIHNSLPDFLQYTRAGSVGFHDIDRTNWRSISCSRDRRFMNESEIRAYLCDFILEEIKDPGTTVLQECECYREGQRTGRADYFVQIGGRWIAVESKLDIRHERNILGQVSKYLGVTFFIPEKGSQRGKSIDASSSMVCLLVDRYGFYVVRHEGFFAGDAGQPAVRREDLTAETQDFIRFVLMNC
jgi:hypothetical protein